MTTYYPSENPYDVLQTDVEEEFHLNIADVDYDFDFDSFCTDVNDVVEKDGEDAFASLTVDLLDRDEQSETFLNTFEDSQILDVLGDFEGFHAKKDNKFEYVPTQPSTFKTTLKSPSVYSPLPPILGTHYEIFVKDADVVLQIADIQRIIGKHNGVKFHYKYEWNDLIVLAGKYSEHTRGKGTCLGYSLFIHLCAIIAISVPESIIEPEEGFDLLIDGISFEITGENWELRQTNANVIINKYAICETLIVKLEDRNMLRFSFLEDKYDTSAFLNSAFDQVDSPYTQYYNRLHQLTTQMDFGSLEGLYNMLKHWYANRPIITRVIHSEINLDTSPLREALIKGAKHPNWDKTNYYLPAPFRILPSDIPFTEAEKTTYKYLPYISDISIGTSFHTLSIDDDPTDILLKRVINKVTCPIPSSNPTEAACWNMLMQFQIFRSIYVESELMSKIVGKQGYAFSDYTNVGICWRATHHNSNVYYIAYLTKSKPDVNCGIYTQYQNTNIWQSPTIKVTTTDINYATVLPHRVLTQVMSTVAYTRTQDRPFVLQQLMLFASTLRWSTWQTTKLTGDTRFMVLCLISRSGDPQDMLNKIAAAVKPNIAFPDSMFLRICIKSLSDYHFQKLEVTPLLKLPIRFIAIEKDWPLHQMWHMRTSTHATDCYRKLCKGLDEEKVNRNDRLAALMAQVAFLEKAADLGVKQTDFDVLMSKMPDTPYYNHIIMLALGWRSASTLDAGKRQDPVKMSLSLMISDHNATTVNQQIVDSKLEISKSRVADGFILIDNLYEHPTSMHQLINRMSLGPKITNIYAIHPKDSKSKDREIPQMTNFMRPIQYMSEALVTVYTDAEDTDMMQNPEKYARFVRQFGDIMMKNGITRSEDKSFFCGNIQPEGLSLVTLIVGKLLGNTSLVTSSAIQRVNKCRWTISPKGCDLSIIPDDANNTIVHYREGQNLYKAMASLHYYHMQQGVLAINAALLTTLFTSGMDLMQKDLIVPKKTTVVMTTSDDSSRGIAITKQLSMNTRAMCEDYLLKPILLLNAAMMKDSIDKEILSGMVAEFNNVSCGPNGMYPQQFVHSHLIIQPLTGLNPIDDIVMCVSGARMSLTWGDSIDVSRAAMSCYLILLRQKWLFNDGEIDLLRMLGLLPITDEDLIRGFCIQNESTLTKLWTLIDLDKKDLVLSGRISLLESLRRFNVVDRIKRRVKLVNYSGSLITMERTLGQINITRRLQNRQNQKYHRYIPLQHRINTKNNFITSLQTPVQPIEQEVLIKLKQVCSKPRVLVIPTRPTRRDFQPCRIGNKVSIVKRVSVASIESYRLFKRYCTVKLDRDEIAIALMDNKSYEEWLGRYKLMQLQMGVSFTSPSGRPLMHILNNKVLPRPMCMNIEFQLPDPTPQGNGFTFGGVYYPKFKPMWISESILDFAEKERAGLCFGWADLGNERHIFFKPLGSAIVKRTVPINRQAIVTVSDRNRKYVCLMPNRVGPIDPMKYKVKISADFSAEMSGDTLAVVNYGNYLNTSNYRAIAIVNNIYRKFKSECPNRVHKIRPEYPWFPPNVIELEVGMNVTFIGYEFVTKLRLIRKEGKLNYRSIVDVSHDPPRLINDAKPVIEEEVWDD